MIASNTGARARSCNTVALWLALGAFAVLPDVASALPRAWVSAEIGIDSGACTRTAPCRTFTYAIAQVDACGEVNALDSGGFGAMTITKSVTVNIASGISALILAPTGDAVTINAGAADRVVLRGLAIRTPAGHGIVVNSVGRLQIENSELNGSGIGILLDSLTPAGVVITDVILRSYATGIDTRGPVQIDLDLERIQVIGSANAGIVLGGPNVRANMRRSSIFGSFQGIVVNCSSLGDSAQMISEDNVIGNAFVGIQMNAYDTCTSEITLSGNVISNNVAGVSSLSFAAPTVVFTRQNNTFVNNTTDISGTPPAALTPLASQ